MASDSPAIIIFNTDGIEVSVKDNISLQNNTSGLLIAGSDGYNSHHILTDNIGRLVVTGQTSDGYTIIAGKDNTNSAQIIKTLSNGVIENKYYELSTFNIIAENIQTEKNKSLFSLVNNSNRIIRIEEIYLINARTTNVTGISGLFEIRRIISHFSGSIISNIESYDTDDILDPSISIFTNSTVIGESLNLLWKTTFNTNRYNTNSIEITNVEHIFQTMFPIFVKKTNNTKTITIRNNQGINIKFISNSSTGIFDIFCVITQE